MTVNRNNFEIYIIDYFDGKLTPVESAELIWFLSQNPDLEEAFNSFENFKLPVNSPEFNDIKNLRKKFKDIPAITTGNFEEFCIAHSEGDLDESSSQKLLEYLDSNPDKKKDFKLYQKTKLYPDKSVVFPNKNSLKKQKSIILKIARPFIYAGAAAAIILMIIITNVFRTDTGADVLTNHAKNEEQVTSNPETASTKTQIVKPFEKNNLTDNLPINRNMNGIKKSSDNNITKPAIRDDHEASYLPIKPIEAGQIHYISAPSSLVRVINKMPDEPVKTTQASEEKSLAAYLIERITSREIGPSNENINIWTLAEASVKGISYLTESDVQIARKFDDNGKMSSFAIESESFGFSSPIKK